MGSMSSAHIIIHRVARIALLRADANIFFVERLVKHWVLRKKSFLGI